MSSTAGNRCLDRRWRGQGIGHRFFDAREAHARHLNTLGAAFRHVAFCAVVREPGDVRQPVDYRSLDGFLEQSVVISPVAGLVGTYSWREIGQATEAEHPMQFWMRAL